MSMFEQKQYKELNALVSWKLSAVLLNDVSARRLKGLDFPLNNRTDLLVDAPK